MLINNLLKRDDSLFFSVSATSRSPRPGEQHGIHYYFLSPSEFDKLEKQNAFLETVRVYNYKYGTFLNDFNRSDKHVICDMEVEGCRKVAGTFPDRTVKIMLLPPSFEIVLERLKKRKCGNLHERIKGTPNQLEDFDFFDYIVINNQGMDVLIHKIESIILSERLKYHKPLSHIEKLKSDFIDFINKATISTSMVKINQEVHHTYKRLSTIEYDNNEEENNLISNMEEEEDTMSKEKTKIQEERGNNMEKEEEKNIKIKKKKGMEEEIENPCQDEQTCSVETKKTAPSNKKVKIKMVEEETKSSVTTELEEDTDESDEDEEGEESETFNKSFRDGELIGQETLLEEIKKVSREIRNDREGENQGRSNDRREYSDRGQSFSNNRDSRGSNDSRGYAPRERSEGRGREGFRENRSFDRQEGVDPSQQQEGVSVSGFDQRPRSSFSNGARSSFGGGGRSFGGDRPSFGGGGRSFGGDRPSFGGGRSFGDDRAPREGFNSESKPEGSDAPREGGSFERRPSSSFGERRSFGGDRGFSGSRGGFDRPPREEFSRPFRDDANGSNNPNGNEVSMNISGSEAPKRNGFSDRGSFDRPRPERSGFSRGPSNFDRPRRPSNRF